jgi:hypothetical protein
MRIVRILAVPVLLLGLSGCLYTNVHAPRAYRSATPSDVRAHGNDGRVVGRSCQQMVLFLFAWGDSGYASAVEDALKEDDGSVLYDVQADVQVSSVLLGTYSRICTVVTGRVGQP